MNEENKRKISMTDEEIARYSDLFKTIVREELGEYKKAAVALSSGIDSSDIMFYLKDIGVDVHAYTFRREGVISTDFASAKSNCAAIGVPFHEVIIPNNIDRTLIERLMSDFGLRKKTEIECCYPMDYVWKQMAEDGFKKAFSGYICDQYFCISKNAMMHYKETLELNQEFRRGKMDLLDFEKTGKWTWGRQTKAWAGQAAYYGLELEMTYVDKRNYDFFYNFSWYELNSPREKYPLWMLFPEYVKKCELYKHTNLQCGDSQIRELFEPLLDDKTLNVKNRKRMLDLYRDWADSIEAKKKATKGKFDKYF